MVDSVISKVKKRDNSFDDFNILKIESAIEKAMLSVHIENEELPKQLAIKVVDEINKYVTLKIVEEQNKLNSTITENTSEIEKEKIEKEKQKINYIPSVEEIQDIIEKVLINEGHAEIAKSYILYRQKRAELRKLKQDILGKFDDSKLSINGLLIAKNRYLLKDNEGNVLESPKEMFKRVSKAVANAEKLYKKPEQERKKLENDFYEIMHSLEFVPSGRILANAGKKKSMLYSSFVIPIEDNIKGVFKALYEKALIQRLGGGTGFSFSRLRQKGKKLTTTSGYASGPVAFIKLFDHASDLTIHSGNRKPANMGSLSVEHPDIIEFITMKDRGEIKNFNISVEITDEFMNAVIKNEKYALKDPSTNEAIDYVDANNIFHLIVTMAWKTGDPGVLFIDKINKLNPLPSISRIETTDPCGDQLLLPYEGGNLGAINLSKFVKYGKISWKRLEEVVKLAVRFLDNVVDISVFPIKKLEETTKGTRKIGLGVLGFADMLYKLKIPYNSEKAVETTEKIMKFISNIAYDTSEELANEKGVFPYWNQSIHKGKRKLRNSSLLAISPSGSRSILADSSPGIEPNFGLGYTRKILGSMDILQLNKVLEQELKDRNLYSEELIKEIITKGSLKNINQPLVIPDDLKSVFITAYEVEPEWQIKIQAAFQKYIDNAISKTINFQKNATIEDIKKAFLMAYELGCNGITVYRQGSLNAEVISVGK
ncbi:MAG: adenosylcobalamin-dependent ribonucleoside-diphosphate reductase [Candidatus Woesearchaeota archaeon]